METATKSGKLPWHSNWGPSKPKKKDPSIYSGLHFCSNALLFRDGKFMVGNVQWLHIAANGNYQPYISSHGKAEDSNRNEINCILDVRKFLWLFSRADISRMGSAIDNNLFTVMLISGTVC